MERLTEYHCGVAVIRDKAQHKEAMEKLAAYEDQQEQISARRKAIDHMLDRLDKVGEAKVYCLLRGIFYKE